MPPAQNRETLEQAGGLFRPETLDRYLEAYDPEVILHGYPPGLPPGVAGARAFYEGIFAAFSGVELVFDETIAEGELLAVRYRMLATHTGEFMGVPATGNEVTLEGQTILRFEGGRIAERWQATDMLGLLAQIGAAPGPG